MSAELRGLGGLVDSHFTARSLRQTRQGFLARPELQPLAGLNNTCLSAYLPDRWERYRDEISPLLRQLNAKEKLVLLAVPARPQLEALNRGGEAEAVLYPQRRLADLAAALGIDFIDLLPAFRNPAGGYDEDLFLPGERGVLHLSAAGHRRLAQWLGPKIIRRIETL